MATGTSMLGTRLLDVLATNSNEVASFGNTGSNVVVRFYEANSPTVSGYLMGLSNGSFAIAKGAAPSNTQIGIGTFAPSSSAQLHVQGTIATSNIISYTADKTLNFPGMTLAGISNINLTGNITVAGVPFGSGQWDAQSGSNMYTFYNIGIGTNNPVGRLEVQGGNANFACNVGIGTNVAPSNLTVQGNALVSGTITVGQLIDQSARSGSYNSWNLIGADGTGAKTVLTNDTTATNRVLFSFNLLLGQYLITANIPYKNLTSLISIDNYNWATIGLYQCTPGTFYDSLPPLYTVPLVALGNDSSEFDTCSFNTFIQVSTNLGTNYVIAVTGKGHQLQIGGTGLPTPVVNTIPIRGIGTDDKISVRQQLQMSPIRTSFTSTAGQQTLNAYAAGVYSTTGSNVDVYINGTKYIWRNAANSDYTVTTSVLNNTTTFSINLSNPLDAGNEVDLVIWPNMDSSNVFSSGYLYQSINNYSVKWLNVNGGGVRTAERLIVDGDLIVGGNVFFGCNTTLFPSGAVWSGDNTSITSNIIGTGNIIDGAITAGKIMDGAVTVSKIAAGTITSDKLALNSINSNLIANRSVSISDIDFNSGSVGIGTLAPRGPLDVNGNIFTNNSIIMSSSNQNMSFDFVQTTTNNAPLVTIQTSNFQTLPTPAIRIEANQLSNLASGASVSAWGPYTASSGQPKYNANSGWLKGSYVQFLSPQSMKTSPSSPITFNPGTSGGLTVVALMRFDTVSPQTVTDGDRVFTLQVSTNTIYLVRNPTNTSWMNIGINFGSSYIFPIASNVINTREWAVYGLTVPSQSGGTISFYKNGRLAGTASMPVAYNTTYAFDTICLGNNASTTFGNLSYGGMHIYDGILTPEQLTSVTNYFMQGYANVLANSRPLIQANPMPYATGDVLMGAPAQSVDVAANLRVRALPSDSMWSIDVYTPTSRFMNRTALPTFNFGVDGATSGIDISSGNYLSLEPAYYRTGSVGTTFIMKYRFNASTTTANEPLLYIGVDAVQGTTTNPYILLARDGTTANLKLSIRNGNGQIAQVSSSMPALVGQYDIVTIAAVIDPSANGTLTIWVNGDPSPPTSGISTSAFGPFQDRFYNNVFIGTSGSINSTVTVYSAAAYNRALSATEIRQAFTALSTDTQFASVDLGSRTGKTALAISKEGYVAPFTMSPDTIPGLIAYLPFDNHIFDATIGINLLTTPQVTGNVQFNNKGRIGQSIVLSNPASSYPPSVPNYVRYPFNYNISLSNITISAWINPYLIGNSVVSSFVSIASTSLTKYAVVLGVNTVTRALVAQYLDAGDTYRTILSTVIPLNTWSHIVLTISSSNGLYLYLNGSLVGSYTTAVAVTTLTSLSIGVNNYNQSNTVVQGWTGEIDDVRIYNRVLTIGEIQALASSPTSPSSLQFNSAGSGTPGININTGVVQIMAPLQLSSTTTVDTTITDSVNNASTVNMTTQGFQVQDLTGIQQNIQLGPGMTQTTASPFTNITTEGAITIPGTTTGYLSFNDSRYVFNWWTTGFTLEMWVNYTTFTNASLIVGGNSASISPCLAGIMTPQVGGYNLTFGADVNGALVFWYYNNLTGVSVRKATPTTMSLNTWYHIAVSCDTSGNIRTFLNGTLEASGVATSPVINNYAFTIGYSGTTAYTNASVTNVRFVRDACLYTASFTYPTVPLSISTSGTTLLLLRNTLNLQTPLAITSAGNMTLAGNISAGNLGMFRNRIINGDMRIDQRYGGVALPNMASSSPSFIMTADRTRFELNNSGTYTLQQVTDAPVGFTHSLRATVTTSATYGANSYSMFTHKIEGYNVADFNLGSSYASPFVVSFWVKSSISGNYGLCIDNNTTESGSNVINGTRGYTTTFRINTANVWEYKSQQIPGETSGTWNNTTGVGMRVSISFGNGANFANTENNRWTNNANKMYTVGNVQLGATNGATFAITGLQVEKGTVATPFEYRPYSTELALCRRYCTRIVGEGPTSRYCMAVNSSSTQALTVLHLPVQLRTNPVSGNFSTSTVSSFGLYTGTTTATITSLTLAQTDCSTSIVSLTANVGGGLTAGGVSFLSASTVANSWLQIDVEL